MTIDPELLLPAREGLLVPGMPVVGIEQDSSMRIDWRLILTAYDAAARQWYAGAVDTGRHSVLQPWPESVLALDLSQRAGRNRAAFWLAERHGFTGFEAAIVMAHPPRMPMHGYIPVYEMRPDGSIDYSGRREGLLPHSVMLCTYPNRVGAACKEWYPEVIRYKGGVLGACLPALRDLDPADPRLLEDGSRWVDAVALRICCEGVL